MKAIQDESLPSDQHYIRYLAELETTYMSDDHDLDDLDDSSSDKPFRIAVCMTPDSSERLRRAKYVQCDIGFKRIVGFQEFELGGLDQDSRTSKPILFSSDQS